MVFEFQRNVKLYRAFISTLLFYLMFGEKVVFLKLLTFKRVLHIYLKSNKIKYSTYKIFTYENSIMYKKILSISYNMAFF